MSAGEGPLEEVSRTLGHSSIPGGPQVRSERSGLRLEAEATGDDGDTAVGVTVTFTETEGDPVDTTRTPISQIWLKNGRVVGAGSDAWSDPAEDLQVGAEGKVSTTVPLEPDSTCLEDPEAGLPSGKYVLYVLTELDPGSGGDRQFMSVEVSSEYVIGG